MRVTLNGTDTHLPEGATIVDALATQGIPPDRKGVAVAVGTEIVRRADWPTTALSPGDAIEIVTAAQGG